MYNTLLAILCMGMATAFTRYFPFLLYSRRKPPEKLLRSARLIPGAVMVVLVFTQLPVQLNISSIDVWLPWLCVLVTAVLHLVFRHPLLSILGGTGLYMLLMP